MEEDFVMCGPLQPEEYEKFKNEEGKIENIEELNKMIYQRGICSELRREVWKHQLGLLHWDKSTDENEEIRQNKELLYKNMRATWKKLTEKSTGLNLTKTLTLIDKDVRRTGLDRNFFKSNNNKRHQSLREILNVYCAFHDPRNGYKQGMNDLAAVVLEVMETDSDAYWCFVKLMDRYKGNFVKDGIMEQLGHLKSMLRNLDYELYKYLKERESDDFTFCFQWILLLFKRQFGFEDLLKLWDVFFTDPPFLQCKSFHLVFCLAVLINKKSAFMDKANVDFSDIIKCANKLQGSLSVEENLEKAKILVDKISASKVNLACKLNMVCNSCLFEGCGGWMQYFGGIICFGISRQHAD